MTRLEPGTVLDGIDRDGAARLIVGTPGSGKTEFALSVLMAGLRRYGGTQAVMAVSGRVAADALGNRVIRELGFSVQARPVTTLGAVAFRAISASREGTGLPSPRLLNGAEQDALLRQVMAVHLRHAVAGDDCGTCDLLRVYFAQDDWARLHTRCRCRRDARLGRFRTIKPPATRVGFAVSDVGRRLDQRG